MIDNAALIRAMRGPIVLITLGVLFTMDYFWQVPFHRTWPLLLIVIGILKLAERMAGQGRPGPGGPPGEAL